MCDKISKMKKETKIEYIDSIVALLMLCCPQMRHEVMYWVACQFALESNFGQSKRARYDNNHCGMKSPTTRISLNEGCEEFAKYASLSTCVQDYILWLSWNHFTCVDLFQLELFTRKLQAKGYCPDKDYLDKVYSIFNQLNS